MNVQITKKWNQLKYLENMNTWESIKSQDKKVRLGFVLLNIITSAWKLDEKPVKTMKIYFKLHRWQI